MAKKKQPAVETKDQEPRLVMTSVFSGTSLEQVEMIKSKLGKKENTDAVQFATMLGLSICNIAIKEGFDQIVLYSDKIKESVVLLFPWSKVKLDKPVKASMSTKTAKTKKGKK